MSNLIYTEVRFVEQPAIWQLDWQTVSAMEETLGSGSTLRLETRRKVVLVECQLLPRLFSGQFDMEAIAP